MSHWLDKYLGKPWQPAGRGPDAFDCWGLVMAVYAERTGLALPEFSIDPRDRLTTTRAIDSAPASGQWARLESPVNHCLVGMGAGWLRHVGIYLDLSGGSVLHAVDGGTVVIDSVKDLKRVYRFPRVEFYQHGAHSIC